MQRTMENFLRALRAVDVRVSPAEAIDAEVEERLVPEIEPELLVPGVEAGAAPPGATGAGPAGSRR